MISKIELEPLNNMKSSLITLSLFVAGASLSSAAVLSTYIDGPEYADTNTPAASSAAGVTASNMSFNSLSGGFGGPVRDVFGSVDLGGDGNVTTNDFWYIVNANQDLGSDPGAGSAVASDYWGFTLTADAGSSLDLTSLTFDYGVGHNDGGTSDFGYRVFTKVDGGAFTSIATGGVASASYTAGDWSGQASGNIDLTSLATTVDGGNVEFRIQMWSSSASGGAIQAFQNITTNGAVVPEPSSIALLGLGGLALLRRRR